MKKFLLLMLGALLSLPTLAQTFTFAYKDNTLTYSVIDQTEKTCKVKEFSEATGDLVIPSKVSDGENIYTVTGLDANALYGCYRMTSVTIPNTVTKIGHSAFMSCFGLTSVSIPESVTSIELQTFANCKSITTISIPTSVTSIGNDAFYGCESLIAFTIPNGVRNIENGTFARCTALSSITIPNSVTSIGENAFAACTALSSVTIPNSVTSIGEYAFKDCSNLTTLSISNNVTSIGNKAFQDCNALTSIYYGAEEPYIGDPNIFSEAAYRNATLYMTETGVILSSALQPWKNFDKIEVYDFAGVEGVTADADETVIPEIYNLNGVKVSETIDNLQPGIYIIKRNLSTQKIIIK